MQSKRKPFPYEIYIILSTVLSKPVIVFKFMYLLFQLVSRNFSTLYDRSAIQCLVYIIAYYLKSYKPLQIEC